MAIVAEVLGTLVVQRRLVEIEAVVGGWLRRIVAARVSARVLLEVAAHLAIVVIVAGRLVDMGSVAHAALRLGILVGTDEDGVVRMGLDMLLQVLGTLEGLATELTLVRFQRNVDTDVRSDVVTLHGGGAARVPLASKAQVVGALASNVALTDVLLA